MTTDQTYLLDSSEKDIHDRALSLLNDVEYQFYPSNMLVEKWIGSYTIILEGDITIYINLGYLIVDGENRAVKNYYTDNIDIVINLLISSDSIEIMDEGFNQ